MKPQSKTPLEVTHGKSTLAQQIVEDLDGPDLIALVEIVGDNSTEDGSDIYKTLNLLTENISILSNGKLLYSNISIPDKNSSMNVVILYRTDRGLGFRGLSAGDPGENVTLTLWGVPASQDHY